MSEMHDHLDGVTGLSLEHVKHTWILQSASQASLLAVCVHVFEAGFVEWGCCCSTLSQVVLVRFTSSCMFLVSGITKQIYCQLHDTCDIHMSC